jgi:hypothetical protein
MAGRGRGSGGGEVAAHGRGQRSVFHSFDRIRGGPRGASEGAVGADGGGPGRG